MLKRKIAAGIMSGTSLDGIDVAFAEIKGFGKHTKINQIAGKTFPYPDDLLVKIKKATLNQMNVSEVSDLNFSLARVYADCVLKLAKEVNIDTKNLYFVASHGQTVYHQGAKDENFLPSTLQLGSGPVMAQLLQTTVITDFRAADMAQGGQGAPLVPFVDFLLYGSKKTSRILQNIGGISNITVLPNGMKEEDTYAFDTGPGNMMINYAMEVLFQKSYDDHGKVAKSGKLIKALFEEIITHPYLGKMPPKSCGREQFGVDYTQKILDKYEEEKKEDIVHTLTKASAFTMIDAIKRFVLNRFQIDQLIVAGGGIHNDFIMDELRNNLDGIEVLTTTELKLDSDFKEALAFIILGNQAIKHKPATLKSTTGAKKSVITGSISFYK
ncbi:anhydro-N-acetylmuramic acid kinase AnmK [Acholeplasma hippikon]|uniref:Anhydro-N-acetylmuramic acid kinase n=1 Tax=Acholeplasma hippikon TaxID=264636 RepID=A0A449BK68_9MOLU|nr:anhydro-N-acetylmuramic acid kinase AnmK [Acholeplasma hippikon]VEU82820.1 Anhydro-N-acetylmuramic acid kinase [Acholeplasma hippikon]